MILIEIENGGHTWPGEKSPISLIGKSTLDISANDLMWDFFPETSDEVIFLPQWFRTSSSRLR